ncbi:MAG: hypothetical protein MRZ79_10395 [Bacteroidia bacterium]|nr:hypothetical protein [Bacteroidia bacterium]
MSQEKKSVYTVSNKRLSKRNHVSSKTGEAESLEKHLDSSMDKLLLQQDSSFVFPSFVPDALQQLKDRRFVVLHPHQGLDQYKICMLLAFTMADIMKDKYPIMLRICRQSEVGFKEILDSWSDSILIINQAVPSEIGFDLSAFVEELKTKNVFLIVNSASPISSWQNEVTEAGFSFPGKEKLRYESCCILEFLKEELNNRRFEWAKWIEIQDWDNDMNFIPSKSLPSIAKDLKSLSTAKAFLTLLSKKFPTRKPKHGELKKLVQDANMSTLERQIEEKYRLASRRDKLLMMLITFFDQMTLSRFYDLLKNLKDWDWNDLQTLIGEVDKIDLKFDGVSIHDDTINRGISIRVDSRLHREIWLKASWESIPKRFKELSYFIGDMLIGSHEGQNFQGIVPQGSTHINMVRSLGLATSIIPHMGKDLIYSLINQNSTASIKVFSELVEQWIILGNEELLIDLANNLIYHNDYLLGKVETTISKEGILSSLVGILGKASLHVDLNKFPEWMLELLVYLGENLNSTSKQLPKLMAILDYWMSQNPEAMVEGGVLYSALGYGLFHPCLESAILQSSSENPELIQSLMVKVLKRTIEMFSKDTTDNLNETEIILGVTRLVLKLGQRPEHHELKTILKEELIVNV